MSPCIKYIRFSFGLGHGDPFSILARLPGLYRVPVPPTTSVFRRLWDGMIQCSIAELVLSISCRPGIPNYDGEVPKREVRAEYPFGYIVKPNDTITSGK